MVFHKPVIRQPHYGRSLLEYYHNVWYGETRMVWLPEDKKSDDTSSHLNIVPVCVGQTDILQQHSLHYT